MEGELVSYWIESQVRTCTVHPKSLSEPLGLRNTEQHQPVPTSFTFVQSPHRSVLSRKLITNFLWNWCGFQQLPAGTAAVHIHASPANTKRRVLLCQKVRSSSGMLSQGHCAEISKADTEFHALMTTRSAWCFSHPNYNAPNTVENLFVSSHWASNLLDTWWKHFSELWLEVAQTANCHHWMMKMRSLPTSCFGPTNWLVQLAWNFARIPGSSLLVFSNFPI